MNIKISLIIAVVFALVISTFTGCAVSQSGGSSPSSAIDVPSAEVSTVPEDNDIAQNSEANKTLVRVGMIKGPSGLGMLELLEKNSQALTKNEYDFTIAGAPQDIQAKLVNGELDIAAVPINLAAALYNKTGQNVNTIAVGTLGVLYLLSRDGSVTDFSSLEGKTIYATGQGATPEYVLSYLIDKNGLTNKISVEYKGEHAELAALVAAGEVEVAMLPQPFVTTVTSKDSDVKIVIDLNDAWRKVSGGTELAMTCIVVRKEFLELNKDAVDIFLREYKQSTEFVNTDIDEAAKLSEKFDIIPEAVAKIAIPKCNIVFIAGDDMKTSANPVLEVLFEANPQSVGGSLPDDAFYYTK